MTVACLVLCTQICIISAVLGSVPGLKSLEKCYEYLQIKEKIPPLRPQSEQDIKWIQSRESIKATLVYPLADGIEAKPKELPFMAALGYENGTNKGYFCGASLISDQFVLTAAHCIFSRDWGLVKYVRLGDLNLANATDDATVQELTIERRYVHPNYSYPRRYHDIALIKLQRPVKFSEYVRPACLEPKREVIRYKTLYAAGWGAIGYGENPSDHLQLGELDHHTIETCQKVYGSNSKIPSGIVDEWQICAVAKSGVTDTCEGDSGGPLAYKEVYPADIFYVTGVTSFGKPCAIEGIPGIYTRVSYYNGWIEKIVWPEIPAQGTNVHSDKIVFPA